MKTYSLGLFSAAALLLVGSAGAQSFNMDNGDQLSPYVLPTSGYGAAAGQTGTWVSLGSGTSAGPLNDINNTPTTVMLTRPTTFVVGANVYNLTGDDLALMGDLCDPGQSSVYTFSNLQAGDYAVYTYAWASDFNTAQTIVTPGAGSIDPAQTVGAPWSGSPHVLGTTYALHHFTNVPQGGSISLTFTVGATFSSINGFQFVYSPNGAALTPFCFGDGSATACPCGNAGAVGNGCASSVSPSGAHLAGTGNPSITNDTLTLDGTLMPNSSALYFQGTSQTAGGAGTVFGDGLRCAGGTVIRLGTKTNVGGASSYPAGSTPISIKGANSAGNVRTYQCWYRNAAAFCTPSTFNLTNGVQTTWQP
jgi:hypothetical protein